MKIIYEGNKPNPTSTYNLYCNRCGCIFEAMRKEGKIEYRASFVREYWFNVKCPKCKNTCSKPEADFNENHQTGR